MVASLTDSIPYSAEAPNLTPEAFALEQVIALGVDAALMECRVAMPAAIVRKYADQTVDLQPLLKTRFWGQEATDLPELLRVPVSMPQGADWRVSYPIAVGDTGYALFMDRRIDAWLAGSGGSADPGDVRAHDLSDAVFVPGLVPTAKQTTDTGTDLVLGNGALQMRLAKSGRITVKNQAQELIDLLLQALQAQIDTLSALASASTLGMTGPQPFIASTVVALNQLGATVTAIKANLSTLKGA